MFSKSKRQNNKFGSISRINSKKYFTPEEPIIEKVEEEPIIEKIEEPIIEKVEEEELIVEVEEDIPIAPNNSPIIHNENFEVYEIYKEKIPVVDEYINKPVIKTIEDREKEIYLKCLKKWNSYKKKDYL